MPYTPEQENRIRRAAQADRVKGAEALFRNRKKPEVDIGGAVKRAVTGAVQSVDWSKRNLHPSQFPSLSKEKPISSRIGRVQTSKRGESEVVRRQTVKMSKRKMTENRFPL